jgi:hypothetical protein
MTKGIWFFFGTQHVPHIKGLPAIEPLGIIGVDWETRRGMSCLMDFLGTSTNVRECTALVHRPAVDVFSLVQLVKKLQPIVQIGMSPAWLDDGVYRSFRVRIYVRLIRRHSICPQRIQDVKMLSQRAKELGNLAATLEQLHQK